MVIKRPYTTPFVETAFPIDPLHKEEPSLPLTIRINHVRYQSQGSLTMHKVVKPLGSGNLLGFVVMKKFLKG